MGFKYNRAEASLMAAASSYPGKGLRMSDPALPSAGEVGGVFAGVMALLASLGAGVRWVVGWKDARAQTRSAKLTAWHDELAAREAKLDLHQAQYQARIEARLVLLERENSAQRRAIELLTGVLRAADPGNPALDHAEQIIAEAVPE